ncbi:MAG: hypothetical protein EZS28_023193 [Streblomastix strix]|uniref:Uncharacterized protein n=1 Tax=Streblomastix strix TaxID=222440 RepID=A0A5J4VFB3_9EUKA|nr:MAG: hypothetical protein EZS28_023193 [Streblomastix strix]
MDCVGFFIQAIGLPNQSYLQPVSYVSNGFLPQTSLIGGLPQSKAPISQTVLRFTDDMISASIYCCHASESFSQARVNSGGTSSIIDDQARSVAQL